MTLEILHDAHDGLGYVGALERKGNVVWAVGGAWGTPLVMTSEGGKTFRRRKPPDASGLRDVLPLGEGHALVVGETGALFETKDAETWRAIETGTKGCLFTLERAHGSIWLAGDDALVMTSADGITWRKPRLGKHTTELGRIQRLTHALGTLWFLGYEGKLGVLKKEEITIAPLDADGPLTAIAFSPRGVGIVVGDGGQVFRTTNKGRAWSRVDIDTEDNLEDAIWHDGRFVVVGAEGTLLVSEDGEAFRKVVTGRSEHLWCALPGATDGVIIGGDSGLLVFASKESLTAAKPLAAKEAGDGARVASGAIAEALSEAELASASSRWIAEGKRYYQGLNAFVAQFYGAGDAAPKLDDEPKETRKDMAPLVQRAAVQLNREKRWDDLRRLFPPSYEAFDYEDIGQSIAPAMYVGDGSIVARVSDVVHRIRDVRIETLSGVTAFGRSHDRKHFCLAFSDRIEIREGIEGTAHTVLALPKSLGRIKTLEVFPTGDQVLAATERGVWIVSNRGTESIHEGTSYVHAALSPDGRIIACGDQDSPHRILQAEAGTFVLAAEITPMSPYPHHAVFHDALPHVCLSACHFARSSSLGFDLGVLKTKKKKALRIEAGDERVTLIDDRRWIYSGLSEGSGYLLGDRDGYAWHFAFDGQLLGYLHIGSTMEAMDSSADKKRLLFGTCAGLLVEFDRESPEPDVFKVTSSKNGHEVRRWVFWRGFPPLVW